MSALAVPSFDSTLQDPVATIRGVFRASWQRINDRASSLLGLPIDEFGRRFPSFVRGSVAQSAACYRPAHSYTHTGGPALMLVPGLFCMPSVFNRLGRELERRGVDVYLPKPFPLAHGILANICRMERSAEMLVRDLERLRSEEQRRSISLAGHSLGGLIVLRAIEKATSEQRRIPKVARVIIIASPLRGAPISRLLRRFIPACRDMVPGCTTLTELQPSMRHISQVLVSGCDSLVPDLCQVAPGAERVYMNGFQHMDFYVGTDEQVQQAAETIADVLPKRGDKGPRGR